MARTIDEIRSEMIAAKEATPELSGLSNSSNVSVWRLIFNVCAIAISIVENLYDLIQKQVLEDAQSGVNGTLQWHAQQTLEYQHGDVLVFNRETGGLDYANVNTDLQIVKLSASNDDSTGKVYVKAAKIVANQAAALSLEELNGLISYWEQKKFAGTKLTVLSEAPDKLHINYRVIYNGTVLNEDGELLADLSIKPVEDAINNYLIDFGLTNFNGNFQLMLMTDAIQAALGVVNVVNTIATAVKDDDTGFTDIKADDNNIYETVAGYMVIDPSFPLSSNITYESQT